MKPIIFYHKNCADGFGAAFAAWKHFGADAEYIAVQYGDVKEVADLLNIAPVEGRDVYILDFSFPHDVMIHITVSAAYTTWLDHHKTAFEMWVPEVRFMSPSYHYQTDDVMTIKLDNTKSGAMIAWEHFHGNNYWPMLIQHIDDYDRWVFKYADTKPFNKALWSLTPWTFEQWDVLIKDTASPRDPTYMMFIAMGDALLRDHSARVTKHVNKPRRCVVGAQSGLAINAPGYVSSDAGHELAIASGTYGMTYTIDDTLMVKCSMRSNGDYDVSALAKAYGGGGHKNAAGFECSIPQLLSILDYQV